jgi:hypothetical protein
MRRLIGRRIDRNSLCSNTMSLNFREVFDLIQSRLHSDHALAEDMHAVIDCCEESCPHQD